MNAELEATDDFSGHVMETYFVTIVVDNRICQSKALFDKTTGVGCVIIAQ